MAVKTPLKWVGSKARLMPQLRPHLPEGKRLVEPLAGSCAVMMNTDYDEYLIADVNPDLIHMYRAIKEVPDQFIWQAKSLFESGNNVSFYYDIRERFNTSSDVTEIWKAVAFLYLNRHCFNGLCRYNKYGSFNVPYGKYKKPYFPETEIKALAEKAKRATFLCASYAETLDLVRDGDVVYCDPPYLTESENFTAYHSGGFNHIDQGRLSRRLRKLATKGVPVVASNADLEMVHYLYAGFNAVRVNAPRSVGAAADSQKMAAELILKWPSAATCEVSA
ncbi:Dam family site-specific DNA-(adenine-N6)-methyltransferase [Salmonella enterica]|nr:Dam family site-specific DNA-(adenine-N6)-methyltransferase [Salmonella enterica]